MECWGELVTYMEDPAVVGKFSAFSVKAYVPFPKDAFPGCAELVSSH